MQDLTSGSITRHLLKTAGYMLVTMVFQTLYFLIDLYWVGRLGKEAVAAVGVAGNLTFIVVALTQMLGVGTTTLVAHAVGRQDRDRAVSVFNQSQVLAVVAGVLFLLASTVLRDPYVRVLSADAQTAALASDYLKWFLPAMALQFAVAGMAAALRGTGNFRPGMVVQTAAVILNMVLAPFLIFGWVTGRPFGVAGAAIASLIAVAASTVWLSLYLVRVSTYLRLDPASWRPDLKLWGQMLKIGLPPGTEFALLALYLVVVYTVSRPFGAAAQAGFGIGMRLVQAGFMPVVALGFAVAPVAGQNFGAAHPSRVRDTFRTAVVLATAIMIAFAIVCNVFGAGMIRVFSNDAEVIAVAIDYLTIVSWTFAASGIIYVGSSMFQAMGNTIPPLVASVLRIVSVAVPALWLARRPDFQLRWIWYLSAASILFQLALNLVLLYREFRLRLAFTAQPQEAA